jgi:hypothetical protein
VGHVRYGGEEKFRDALEGKPERKNHLEDICVEGKILPKWILNK